MHSLRALLILISLYFVPVAMALDLELTQGISSALPIAVAKFDGDVSAQDMQKIIKNDLHFSGQFRVISANSAGGQEANLQSWRAAGADSMVRASIRSTGNNQTAVEFRLLDAVGTGNVLLQQSFQVPANLQRALAHHISDMIYQKLTGERGIFSTKIAYILVKTEGKKRRFSLEVADADGYNPHSLLLSPEPIMSPSWSPNGKQIAYVSFEKKKAQIYTVEVASGKRRLISDFSGINGAPAWSTDGSKLALVLSKNGSPKIYEVQLASGTMRQLTTGSAIDTEPRYAPDGRSLLFTSGRGGAPQIYQLNLSNGAITRLSYDGNYNARASYTPDQKNIVMLHREERNFNIGLQSAANGRITQLTFSNMDESPSVAPNGRLVLYATQNQDRGVLAVVSIDGRIRLTLPAREGDVQEPAWSPFLG